MQPNPSNLTEIQQELIVDVVDGAIGADDPRIVAELSDDRFAQALAAALAVARRLRQYGRDETAAVAAVESPLDGVAVAAARRHLGLDRGTPRTNPRVVFWLVGFAAAVLVVAWLWRGDTASPREPRDRLGDGAVVTVDATTRTLHFAPALGIGQTYIVEFGSDDRVVKTIRGVATATLALPDLPSYPPVEWVRVTIVDTGGAPGSGPRVPLPAALRK